MNTQSEKNNAQNEAEVAASGAGTHRRRNLVIVTFLLLVTATVVTLAYSLFWQHEEETGDAYMAGRLAMITPQVNDTMRKAMYDDMDVVKKGDVLVALDGSGFQLTYGRAQSELIQAIRQNKQ